jgi:tripartite-type tricarboxylate transporter receptor subunit TctC
MLQCCLNNSRKMRRMRQLFHRGLILTLLGLSMSFAATAQGSKAAEWPNRPIKILVGFPAGSTPDVAARTLGEPLAKLLGQPVIVENRAGASGNIAAEAVAKASDDHTLGVVINGNLTSAKMLNPKLAFDPAKDFAMISLLATAPLILVTAPNQPGGKEFFAAAKAGGGQWNYGSVGVGSVGHLGMELLKSKVPGMDAVHVPFQGNPQVVTAMIGGQIQAALIPPGVAMPQVRAGKIRAVGLAGPRSTLVPELEPLPAAGVSSFDLEVWTALVAPANLPAPVVRKLSAAVVEVLRQPETRQRLFTAGWQAVGTSPEGLKLRVEQEAKAISGIIATRGIKLD